MCAYIKVDKTIRILQLITNYRNKYIGIKFGFLTIVDFIGFDNKQTSIICKTKCDCEIEKELYFSYIKQGAKTSCGQCNIKRFKKVINKNTKKFVGVRFGKLTVLEITTPNINNYYINCIALCDCGKITTTTIQSLKSGSTKSCGCFHSTNMVMRFKEKRESNIGKKFGRLEIIKFIGVNKDNTSICKALCDCGKIKEYRFVSIKNGTIQSCGCFNVDCHTIHGLSKSPLYSIWCNIKRRCYCENNHNFPLYGKVGVKMCDEWLNNFKSFHDWCRSKKWDKGLQVDRFPNKNGNYCPENCRIATPKQNSNNKTNNRIFNINGCLMTFAEATEKYNIKPSTLFNRLKSGMDICKALNTPIRGKN